MTELPYTPNDVVDTAALVAVGLHSHDIDRLGRAGRLRRLATGWFATRAPHDARDRHVLLARALARHFDGRAAVSHHSRLGLLGLATWRADLRTAHLTRVADRGDRTAAGTGFTRHSPGLHRSRWRSAWPFRSASPSCRPGC